MKQERQNTFGGTSSVPARTPTAAILFLLLAFLSACATGRASLGPDEVSYTTMGYSYSNDEEREKLEANWSSLEVGMSAVRVFELLGLQRASPMRQAVEQSEMFDIAYGGNLLKFRAGNLTEFLRNAAPDSNFQRTVIVNRK